MKISLLSLMAIMIVALSLTGCGNLIKAKSLAEPQVDVFHQLFNAEKYSDIYSASNPKFQAATSEKKLTDLLAAVHRKLGSAESTSTVNWNVNTFNMTTRIVLVQNTKFDKGSAIETFTYIVSDPDATLLGYNISSTDLIEK
jgi:hypothetical protein